MKWFCWGRNFILVLFGFEYQNRQTLTTEELTLAHLTLAALLRYQYTQIGAIVCLIVLAVGLTMMKPKSTAKKAKATPKKTPVPSVLSPASTKRAAKGAGSVATPAGRRSARLARKNMEKDN